jgi:hypothetical protein
MISKRKLDIDIKNLVVKGFERDKITIPPGVTDSEAYRDWVMFSKWLEVHPYRRLKHDITGKEFSPHQQKKRLEDMIADLPKKRRDEIWKMRADLQFYQGWCSHFKRLINLPGGGHGRFVVSDPMHVLSMHNTELLELFGKYYSCEDVHRVMVEDWKMLGTTLSTVRKFYLNYKKEIGAIRALYDEDYSDVSLHSKRYRLGEFSYLYRDRKRMYELGHKLDDSKEMRAILDQAKKEVDGEALKLTIEGNIDIQATISVEQQVKMISGLTLNQLIVSRVAGRLGINPMFMMSRLSNSIYSRFNGFQKNDSLMTDQPEYPSTLVYDFDKIKNQQEQLNVGFKESTVVVSAIEQVTGVKEAILQKIAEKRKKLEETSKEIEGR